jgi:hypothetical protein
MMLVFNSPCVFFNNKYFVSLNPPLKKVYGEHLKNRLAEFQIQGKFKQLPKGILYMGVELPCPPLRLGLVMGATVKLCMGFASSRIMNLHWSLGTSGSDGESPHMVRG